MNLVVKTKNLSQKLILEPVLNLRHLKISSGFLPHFLVNFGSFLFKFFRNSYVFLKNFRKNHSKFPQKLRQKDSRQALKKRSVKRRPQTQANNQLRLRAISSRTFLSSKSVNGIRPFCSKYPSAPIVFLLIISAINSRMPLTKSRCSFLK